MSKHMNTPFTIDAPFPVDTRMQVATKSALDSIAIKYDRMLVYILPGDLTYGDTEWRYYLEDILTDPWKEVTYGGGISSVAWEDITGNPADSTSLVTYLGDTYALKSHLHVTDDISPEGGFLTFQYIIEAPNFILTGSDGSNPNPVILTYTDLIDTDADYAGHGGDILAVKQTEDGVEFLTYLSTIGDRLRLRGDWVEASYAYNDVAREGAYLGAVINQAGTTDHVEPQNVGDPFYVYQGTIGTYVPTAKTVLFGTDYTNSVEAVKVTKWRVDTVTGNYYRVMLVKDPDGTPILSELLAFEADSTGWVDIAIDEIIINVGVNFRILCEVNEPDATPNTTLLNYNYITPSNLTVPTSGQIMHDDKNRSILRVHKTDNDSSDNTTFLEGLTAGDIIQGPGVEWSIQGVNIQTAYVEYAIAPSIQGSPDGVYSFGFETVTATPITIGRDVNYWLGDADVRGLYAEDGGIADVVENDNAYGLDIEIQQIDVSPDWYIMAVTGGSGLATSGDTGGSPVVIIDNLTTQDATKALSANQGYVLDQAKADKVDVVNSVVEGTDISIDNTDPNNPIINSTFAQTGTDTDDVVNVSTVTGTTASDALETLDADIIANGVLIQNNADDIATNVLAITANADGLLLKANLAGPNTFTGINTFEAIPLFELGINVNGGTIRAVDEIHNSTDNTVSLTLEQFQILATDDIVPALTGGAGLGSASSIWSSLYTEHGIIGTIAATNPRVNFIYSGLINNTYVGVNGGQLVSVHEDVQMMQIGTNHISLPTLTIDHINAVGDPSAVTKEYVDATASNQFANVVEKNADYITLLAENDTIIKMILPGDTVTLDISDKPVGYRQQVLNNTGADMSIIITDPYIGNNVALGDGLWAYYVVLDDGLTWGVSIATDVAAGGGGGDVYLAASQAFTGINTFEQEIIIEDFIQVDGSATHFYYTGDVDGRVLATDEYIRGLQLAGTVTGDGGTSIADTKVLIRTDSAYNATNDQIPYGFLSLSRSGQQEIVLVAQPASSAASQINSRLQVGYNQVIPDLNNPYILSVNGTGNFVGAVNVADANSALHAINQQTGDVRYVKYLMEADLNVNDFDIRSKSWADSFVRIGDNAITLGLTNEVFMGPPPLDSSIEFSNSGSVLLHNIETKYIGGSANESNIATIESGQPSKWSLGFGQITAPTLTEANILLGGDQSLITKKYAEDNLQGGTAYLENAQTFQLVNTFDTHIRTKGEVQFLASNYIPQGVIYYDSGINGIHLNVNNILQTRAVNTRIWDDGSDVGLELLTDGVAHATGNSLVAITTQPDDSKIIITKEGLIDKLSEYGPLAGVNTWIGTNTFNNVVISGTNNIAFGTELAPKIQENLGAGSDNFLNIIVADSVASTKEFLFDTAYDSGTSVGTRSDTDNRYEAGLGNPGTDGYVLSSTIAGIRSWIVASTGTIGGSITSGRIALGNGVNTITGTSNFIYTSADEFITEMSGQFAYAKYTNWISKSLSIGVSTTDKGYISSTTGTPIHIGNNDEIIVYDNNGGVYVNLINLTVPTYADEAAAAVLNTNDVYKTSTGELRIKL